MHNATTELWKVFRSIFCTLKGLSLLRLCSNPGLVSPKWITVQLNTQTRIKGPLCSQHHLPGYSLVLMQMKRSWRSDTAFDEIGLLNWISNMIFQICCSSFSNKKHYKTCFAFIDTAHNVIPTWQHSASNSSFFTCWVWLCVITLTFCT